MNKSTDQLGYKQEAKFTSTEKYVVKVLGFTTEYWTQVKFKESVYPNKTGSSSSDVQLQRQQELQLCLEMDENSVCY